MQSVVELSSVQVVRGDSTVLDFPALDVRQGAILAIIGTNGAGKATLLRVLVLLDLPATGVVRFRGRPVTSRDGLALRRRMASVFQEPLLADTSVRNNVALGLRFRGEPTHRIGARVEAWLERFGITPLASRQARTLSGGEAQRTARAGVRAGAGGAPVGRAVRGARPSDARSSDRRFEPDPRGGANHDRPRHPRSRRGDGTGRSRWCLDGRALAADRRGRAGLSRAAL